VSCSHAIGRVPFRKLCFESVGRFCLDGGADTPYYMILREGLILKGGS